MRNVNVHAIGKAQVEGYRVTVARLTSSARKTDGKRITTVIPLSELERESGVRSL